jgi:two-component sensor histidine kinase
MAPDEPAGPIEERPTPPTEVARRERIQAEQVALLFGQGIVSQVVTMVNATLVAVVLWGVAPHASVLGWLGLMALTALARVGLTQAYRRTAHGAGPSSAPWREFYIAATLFSGIGWGAAGVLLFPFVALPYQVFLAYVLGGMAVGAAAVMSPVLVAYYAFLAPITLPVIVQLFAAGDTMSLAMGVMFTACTGMFANSARQMHGSIVDSIRLRFENLDLIESLSRAKQQAEAANASLQVEIGERRRAEEQVTASLREKEVLLTEIHHRVKNNLQVISSLLSLQSRSLSNPEVTGVFTDSQNRVRSMALVHEKLYQSRDLARIDFAAYVRELASHLFRVYRSSAEGVALRVNAKEVFLTVERAVPCGLILSELLSNALKYAFPDGTCGEIAVDLDTDDARNYRMTIRDNGVGLPASVDLRLPRSLGLRIVKTLSEQLGGTIAASNARGTTFTLAFPIEDRDAAHA